MQSLQIGHLVFSIAKAVFDNDTLKGLLGRELADCREQSQIILVGRSIVGSAQVVVYDGTVDGIVRIEREAHNGNNKATHSTTAHDERVARHKVERIVMALILHQHLGNSRTIFTRAAENQNIVVGVASRNGRLDVIDNGRLVLIVELNSHIATLVGSLARCLLKLPVCRKQHIAQLCITLFRESFLLDSLLEQFIKVGILKTHHFTDSVIVELDNLLKTAPIIIHRHLGGITQVSLYILLQDSPIASAPAVYRLLHIAHNQHRLILRLRHSIAQQGHKVMPLLERGILKLVDHKTLKAIAHLLVDEGGVVIGDKTRKDMFGLGE